MTTVIDHKARQRAQWNGAAAAWDRRFAWYSDAFRPLISRCCDAAGIETGARVLDIGCGSGQPSFDAASRVGPSGEVVAIDIATDMLAFAERRARAAGLRNIRFVEMDAEALQFEDASFDAVTCSCALMFFPDAVRAVSEMRRVLRPGGRCAVSVWDEPAKNAFMTLGGGAVAQFFPPAPPAPNAPGGFRFAPPGALAAVLGEGAFEEVAIESIRLPFEFASVDEYWALFTEMAAGLADKVRSLPPAELAQLQNLVGESARTYIVDGQLQLAATALCAAGHTSGR